MRHIVKLFLTGMAILVCLPAARAAEYGENWCGGEAPHISYGVAKVVGKPGQKIALHSEDSTQYCPCTDPGVCPVSGDFYLKPGDQVITLFTYRHFTSISYLNASGYPDDGWVRTSDLVQLPDKDHPAGKEWIGTWSNASYSIAIHALPHKMLQAIISDPDKPSDAAQEFNATEKPAGDSIHVVEKLNGNECLLELRLVGHFLMVTDNNKCHSYLHGIYEKNKNFSSKPPVG